MLIQNLLESKSISGVLTVTGKTPAADAVSTMNKHHVGALLVVDEKKQLLGILSERDILTHFTACAKGVLVEEIMTPRSKLIIGHREDSIDYAMQVITVNRIRHLPILDGDTVVGLVSIGDVLKAHLQSVESENKMLEDYINGASLVI
jgi:CBS domain-containing protein